jgi:phosphatidylserine decarboxylase
MIRIHKEGRLPILLLLTFLVMIHLLLEKVWPQLPWVNTAFLIVGIGLLIFFLQFFRNPIRLRPLEEDEILCPADGKVVIVEKVMETEYYKEERLQVSIFMSPLNVHVNRYPISGKVAYAKYHKGKFLVAWNPKSSLLNERTSVVVQHPKGESLLYRQIAGALARRIIMYAKEGQSVKQGTDCGFIRFGSRVDLLLPVDTELDIQVGDVVKGGITRIGRWKA